MVEVDVKFGTDLKHEAKFGVIVGVSFWSPPRRPEMLFPYVVFDTRPFTVTKWERRSPLELRGEVGEGDFLYFYNSVLRWPGYFKVTRCGVGAAREGETYTVRTRITLWEARNVEYVVNDWDLMRPAWLASLRLYARRQGWRLGRRTEFLMENLVATWLHMQGYVKEVSGPFPEGVYAAYDFTWV